MGWLFQIPRTVWVLGVVTLLINVSSVMIYSLWPLYVTHVFGLAVFHFGILEGFLEFSSWVVRIVSGVVSDALRRRKPFLLFSYILIFLTRPLLAWAPAIGWAYGARLLDRFSNGFQATPRDALIGDTAPKALKGSCFGLKQSLGFAGSFLGAGALAYWSTNGAINYSSIFLYASLPPLTAILAVSLFASEPAGSHRNAPRLSISSHIRQIANLSPLYWKILIIAGVVAISYYSAAYRTLYAEHMGLSISLIPMLMIAQNAGSMLAGLPAGKLSDTFDRRIMLAIGLVMTIFSNLCLSVGTPFMIITSSLLWGVNMGTVQSVFLSMITDVTETGVRGTAFGLFYFVNAIGLFCANTLTGWLFDSSGPKTAVAASTLIVSLGLLLIPLIGKCTKHALAAK